MGKLRTQLTLPSRASFSAFQLAQIPTHKIVTLHASRERAMWRQRPTGRPACNCAGPLSLSRRSYRPFAGAWYSQSVSLHYHTPINGELMTLTHSIVLLFRVRWEYLHLSCCFCVFSSSSSSALVFRQGPHFGMMFVFPLLLVVDLDENGLRR